MSEIRQNILTGDWVVIAPERGRRPTNLAAKPERPAIPERSPTCPFCPGNESMTADERYRLAADDGTWRLRSIVNKFSVLGSTAGASPGQGGNGDRMHDATPHVPGVGRHEVVIEHPRHDLSPALYPAGHLERLVEAWARRFADHCADPLIRHVIVFKNHGEASGASQQHPHSQVVGLPIVPGQVRGRVERGERHRRKTGECLACRMITAERSAGSRIVDENDAYVAFIPYAALSPFHLWIFPKRHAHCFTASLEGGARDLADVLGRVLGRVRAALDDPAYNLVIRSLVPADKEAESFHWYVSLVPRVGKLAGFELGTGMYVNSSSPEESAARLRAAAPTAVAGNA